MSVEDELDKLKKLHDAGTITDEQYERAKAKLLAEEPVLAEEAHDEKADAKRDEPSAAGGSRILVGKERSKIVAKALSDRRCQGKGQLFRSRCSLSYRTKERITAVS